jgi:RNA polymerase sigma-70 factor, ECF subfamily
VQQSNSLQGRGRKDHLTEQSEAVAALQAKDDPAAFLPLYERYVVPVFRYCHVRLGERTKAEDATSEVFLKALDRISSFRGGSFPAWLFRITRNVIADSQRRRSKDQVPDTSADIPDANIGPEDYAIRSARQRTLRQAITGLTADQRHVLELQLAGWPDADIAAALGKTRDAVKMLRLRSLKSLRTSLVRNGWQPRDWLDEA